MLLNLSFLEQQGGKIIRGIKDVPIGRNMTMEHPDGVIRGRAVHGIVPVGEDSVQYKREVRD